MYRAGGSTTHKEHATHYTRHKLHSKEHTTQPARNIAFYSLILHRMEYTKEQQALFDSYKKEIEEARTINEILLTCLSGRIWTHSPVELPNELRDELDEQLSKKMLELKNSWKYYYYC